MLRFLAGRATRGVESVIGDSYCRTVAMGKARGWLRVQPIAGRHALAVELATSLPPALPQILSRLRNLFDLAARPDVIDGHLSSDERLAKSVRRFPGLRVPALVLSSVIFASFPSASMRTSALPSNTTSSASAAHVSDRSNKQIFTAYRPPVVRSWLNFLFNFASGQHGAGQEEDGRAS